MFASVWAISSAVGLFGAATAAHPAGYLVVQTPDRGEVVRQEVIPYAPREGDLIFYDDHSQVWTALFALAGTGPPLHCGIVVKKSNGTLAVLEAGPDDTLWVALLELAPRLHQFERDFHGTITIRRCKKTLSREASAALTKFAEAQNGKRYAALRLLLQGTALRPRGTLEPYLAGTQVDRDSWICSELVVAAGTVVGLFDPKVVRANATYPRDLVDNRRHNLQAVWQDPAPWQASAPPRRTGHVSGW